MAAQQDQQKTNERILISLIRLLTNTPFGAQASGFFEKYKKAMNL